MSVLWSPREPAQVEYEHLRERALAGQELEPDLVGRFQRLGLAGLVLRPRVEGLWSARVSGARRPPWAPYQDPREQALAEAFSFLLADHRRGSADEEVWR